MDLKGSDPDVELIGKDLSLLDLDRCEYPRSSDVVTVAQPQWK